MRSTRAPITRELLLQIFGQHWCFFSQMAQGRAPGIPQACNDLNRTRRPEFSHMEGKGLITSSTSVRLEDPQVVIPCLELPVMPCN